MTLDLNQIKTLITCVDRSIRNVEQYHSKRTLPESQKWCDESTKPLRDVRDVLRAMRDDIKAESKLKKF